jgi:hypothetical protein
MIPRTWRRALLPVMVAVTVACTGAASERDDDEVLADWCDRADALAEVVDEVVDADDPDERTLAEMTVRSEEFYADPIPSEIADEVALLRGQEPLPDDDEAAEVAFREASRQVGAFAEQRCGLDPEG